VLGWQATSAKRRAEEEEAGGLIDRSIDPSTVRPFTHPLRVDGARRPDGGGVVRWHVLVLLDADERVLAGDAGLPQEVVVPRTVGGGALVELVPVGVVAERRHGGAWAVVGGGRWSVGGGGGEVRRRFLLGLFSRRLRFGMRGE
jgi:hypothetical protein